MMRYAVPVVANLLLATLPAQAQDAPTSPAPLSVCQHSSGMNIGGTNVDELKCQLVTAVQQVSEMSVQSIALQAKLRMAQNDLAAANAELQQLRKENTTAKPTHDATPTH